MAITIKMGDDGILRMHISGNLDNVQVKKLRREITPFLEASTPEHPLNTISTTEKIGKYHLLHENILRKSIATRVWACLRY